MLLLPQRTEYMAYLTIKTLFQNLLDSSNTSIRNESTGQVMNVLKAVSSFTSLFCIAARMIDSGSPDMKPTSETHWLRSWSSYQ